MLRVRARVRARVSAQQIEVARVDDDAEEFDAVRVVELRPQPHLVLQQRQVFRAEPRLPDLLGNRIPPVQLAAEDGAEAALAEPRGGRGGAEYAAAAVGCMQTLTLSLAEAALVVAAIH